MPAPLLSTEVIEFRERFRKFIDEEVIPSEPVLDAEDEGSAACMQSLKASAKRQGLWAIGHPEEIGGGGMPFMDFVYMNEIIGRSHYGQMAVGSLSMQDSIMLHLFGDEAQKIRWLAPLVAGEIYPSVGLTEPEVAGSDPTLMKATARLVGDEWVINGHKWFTSGADLAAFTTVFCDTEPEAARHAKFSAIIVPTGTPGYEVVRVVPTMGGTHGHHCEIRLTDVRVPRENLLGQRGAGFVVAQKRLGPGRIFHCMRWLGQAQRAFELMCDWARVRSGPGCDMPTAPSWRRRARSSATWRSPRRRSRPRACSRWMRRARSTRGTRREWRSL
jgi:alkylation response protein AidB-like acyl-CoA dehydrogenase